MKKTTEIKKKHKKRKQPKNIALRITGDFLRFNGICLMILIAIYLIIYLFLLLEPDLYINVIKPFLIDLFGKSGESFLFSRSYLLVLAAFLVVFVFSCFLYSLITLSLFNKTYQSLDALNNENA